MKAEKLFLLPVPGFYNFSQNGRSNQEPLTSVSPRETRASRNKKVAPLPAVGTFILACLVLAPSLLYVRPQWTLYQQLRRQASRRRRKGRTYHRSWYIASLSQKPSFDLYIWFIISFLLSLFGLGVALLYFFSTGLYRCSKVKCGQRWWSDGTPHGSSTFHPLWLSLANKQFPRSLWNLHYISFFAQEASSSAGRGGGG